MVRSNRESAKTSVRPVTDRGALLAGAPSQPAPRWLLPAVMVGVSLVVAATHWPVLSATALAFDDNSYLVDNPLVRNPSWYAVKRFLTEVLEPTTVAGYYQPLAMISLMLDGALGGSPENLMPLHRTSLILHVLNTGLIIVLLRQLFGVRWIAAAVGLLYGLHPLTVEPIAWVGDRKTPLATLFALAAIVLYVGYVHRRTWPRYAGSIVLFILALLSKPTTTPLPLVLLLVDFWPLRRWSWRAVVEKLPFFVIAAASAVITYVSQSRTLTAVAPEAGAWPVILLLCYNIVYYLAKFAWPMNLTPHTPAPAPFTLDNPAVVAGVIGTILLVVALGASLRWTRAWLTGWLVFFVAILPTMGVIGFTNVVAADKYAYWPLVGLLLPLAWGLKTLDASIPARSRRAWRVPATLVILALAVAAAAATRHQLGHWRTTGDLAQHMLRLAPDSSEVRFYSAYALHRAGRTDEALAQLECAVRLAPHVPKLYAGLATVLYEQGRVDEAIAQFNAALAAGERIRFFPERARTESDLGAALLEKGDYDAARLHFEAALRLRPDLTNALNNMGSYYMRRGDVAAAVKYFRAAVGADARDPAAWANLGGALVDAGQLDEALAALMEATRLKPEFGYGRFQLGRVQQKRGQGHAAAQEYARAIQLEPKRAGPYVELAQLLASQGRFAEALEVYRALLRVQPKSGAAQVSAGILCARLDQLPEALEYFTEAARLDPQQPPAHNRLGLVLVELNRPKDAAAQYRLALQSDPNNAGTYVDLGNALGASGDAQQALDAYRAALKLSPDLAAAYYGLGLALEELGQLDEALAAYREILRVQPGNTIALEQIKALEARQPSSP